MKKKLIAAAIVAATLGAALTGCSSDATTVSKNLSTDAEQFKIARQIVFFNGITDKYLLTIEGLCSIEPISGRLEVTCKVGEGAYTKDFLGLSDNVSYFAHQIAPAKSDPYHYKVIFKPELIVPNINLVTSK